MKPRNNSTPNKDFILLENKKLDRMIFPSIEELKSKFEVLYKNKDSYQKKLYIKLLKAMEDEITQNLTKIYQGDIQSDFLLIRQENEANQDKILYWKENYKVKFDLNKQNFLLPYNVFEGLFDSLEKKNEMLNKMKDIFKNSVKYCIHLKEKLKNLDYNINQFKSILVYKKKEFEKLEKEYQKMSKSKKYSNKHKSMINNFN